MQPTLVGGACNLKAPTTHTFQGLNGASVQHLLPAMFQTHQGHQVEQLRLQGAQYMYTALYI
jgi:hypothetical protein